MWEVNGLLTEFREQPQQQPSEQSPEHSPQFVIARVLGHTAKD